MPKKTWITELSALSTVGFSIYQGYKHSAINPADIGLAVMSTADLLTIAIPALVLAVRGVYKKVKNNA